MSDRSWSTGSVWQRWDPHLHAPGTVLEDRFAGNWEGYYQAIAEADPKPVALGITDYYSLESYERVLERRKEPPFDAIPLVFPNIEIRLALPADGNRAVNAHLLIDPSTPNHVQEANDLLARLTMPANGQNYICRKHKLIELGRAISPRPSLSDEAALREGTTQFKVTLECLLEALSGSSWARDNVLLAVAGGKDGLSGLRSHNGWAALVGQLSRAMHVLFSATPSDIAYWQGDPERLAASGYVRKPCLHGSDAHSVDRVLRPDEDRYCWLRAGPSFEGLRQAMAEPARRVRIGPAPPEGPPPGELIRCLHTEALDWIGNQALELNPGLITIIGARGSGKTAIADLLAYGAFAEDARPGSAAFLRKAERHVRGNTFALAWGGGERVSSTIDLSRDDEAHEPRVRYLSQQFVEQLCNPVGGQDTLVDELETVVFRSLSQEDQKGCGSFVELRQLELERSRTRRQVAEREVERHSERIAELARRGSTLADTEAQVAATTREIANLDDAVRRGPAGVDRTLAMQQKMVYGELTELEAAIAVQARRLEEIGHLEARVDAAHTELGRTLAELRTTFGPRLGENLVSTLVVSVPPGIAERIRTAREATARQVKELRDRGRTDAPSDPAVKGHGLGALREANAALMTKLNINAEQTKRLERTQASLNVAKRRAATLQAELAGIRACTGLIAQERTARLSAYRRVLDELDAERGVLEKLYEPLRQRIEDDVRLSKLSFAVSRQVDATDFLERGNKLFVERRLPGDHGLEPLVRPLLDAWSEGRAETSEKAMNELLDEHAQGLVAALRSNATRLDFGRWLFSTQHLSIEYSIRYEHTPLEHLSPGTRGVVLLTLFLGIDIDDGRPLVIDQPEENLDPKSVYDDLAPFFRDAATRRQIIMVTHNANLVVNTDADQVIVATASGRSPDALPVFTYTAGGLENRQIREHVCSILEGGAEAFERRSKRYDVRAMRDAASGT